jgi:hypothetical protein
VRPSAFVPLLLPGELARESPVLLLEAARRLGEHARLRVRDAINEPGADACRVRDAVRGEERRHVVWGDAEHLRHDPG